MQIPVLVESLGAERFRAEAPPPFSLTAEGRSSEEAVQKLREKMTETLANGKQFVTVEVPAKPDHPWMKYVGHLKDDPLFDQWQAAIQQYRQQRDLEDDITAEERE
jgi:Lon protease-like protein